MQKSSALVQAFSRRLHIAETWFLSHMGFVVDELVVENISSDYFSISPSASFHHCSIIIFHSNIIDAI
jgi:hypothetical protein